ncbi:MAG: biotin/lipoyl-binding protein [Proteobacteria bacterium]|nr:biotin/lipoyl-binding protein [Pseudomonadota bacterium]
MKQTWNEMNRQNRVAAGIGLVVLVVVIIFGSNWLSYRFTHAITDDAFVDSDLINVSPRVPGHLKQLLVDESDTIKKDQLLALLDPADYQAQLEMYEAKLTMTRC